MEELITLPPLLRIIRKLDFPRKLGVLELMFGSSLADRGMGWVKCSNGVVWRLDLSDPTHRWIVYGDYEGGIGLNYAKSILKDGGIFVDSGSNIGQWVLYLGGLPEVHALEFEPVQSQRKWLASCIEKQAGWNVTIYPFGLGAQSSKAEIQCDGARSTLRNDWYAAKGLTKESIEIRKLDDVLQEEQVDEVKLWKLDVEGAEYEALIGARNYLKSQRIKHLFFECHYGNYSRNKSFLEECGYQLYDIYKSGLRLKTEDWIETTQDLVALPR